MRWERYVFNDLLQFPFSPRDSIVEQTFSVGREGAAFLASKSSNFSLLHFPSMMEQRGFPEVLSFLVCLCFDASMSNAGRQQTWLSFPRWWLQTMESSREVVIKNIDKSQEYSSQGMSMGSSGTCTIQIERYVVFTAIQSRWLSNTRWCLTQDCKLGLWQSLRRAVWQAFRGVFTQGTNLQSQYKTFSTLRFLHFF